MPDPLTVATAFATIVSLLADFAQERRAKGEKGERSHRDFIEWLDYHRHEEIKNLICNNAAFRDEMDKLLRADHAAIMAKLNGVSRNLADLLSQVTEFRGLALAVAPEAQLSPQAIAALRLLVESDSAYFVYFHDRGIIMREDKMEFSFHEPRFLGDDLDKLSSLGLLTPEDGSDTTTLFRITRSAARLVETIDSRVAS